MVAKTPQKNNTKRHLGDLPPDRLWDDPPVGEEEERGDGEHDLQELPVPVEQVGNLGKGQVKVKDKNKVKDFGQRL